MKCEIFVLISVIFIRINTFMIYDTVMEEWSTFKTQYVKKYQSDIEEKFRFNIFMLNRKKVAIHNRKYEKGEVPFSLAINKFGDMTQIEFANKMNGFNRTARLNKIQEYYSNEFDGATFIEPANVELPKEVDWRKKGAVSEIKDQGDCGSCWAFSATGSLEGQNFRQSGKLISLSEQNLVDCSGRYGNDGCDGGLMDKAFLYVQSNHGIDTEKSYPYEAKDNICRYNPNNSGADDAGYVDLPKRREDKLQAAVATVGPISVAIDANTDTFMFYSTGIYYSTECSSNYLDHGVLVVGYGHDNTTKKDFWIVKNSWGKDWGESGYIRMSRNSHNNCGIATSASYPLVK